MNINIIVHALIVNNGKVLILKRIDNTYEGGLWDLPGGSLKSGEDLLDGIKREVLEESGLRIDELELFYHNSNVDAKKNKQFITIIFLTTLNDKNPVISISDKEHSQFKWTAPEEIDKYQTVSYLKDCIKYYIHKIAA